MLTLPFEARNAATNRPARILAIGRSETVLSDLVTILREKATPQEPPTSSTAPSTCSMPGSAVRCGERQGSGRPRALTVAEVRSCPGRKRWT